MRKDDTKVIVQGVFNNELIRLTEKHLEKEVTENSYRLSLDVKESFLLKSAVLEMPYIFSDEEVFLNGFQTWSTSRLTSINSDEKAVSMFFNKLQGKYGDYQLTNYDYLHSWSYTYLLKEEYCRVIGSLNEKNAFHIIEFDQEKSIIRIKIDVEELLIENDVFELFNILDIEGKDDTVIDYYFQALDDFSRLPKRKYYGWTSWYQYYTNISEDIILMNLKEFSEREVGLDYFQVDDGYQKAIGDWLHINSKFPNGMKNIADQIHKSGYKAGIWISPFICEKKSNIYKYHRDWLIKDKKGQPLKIGFNPGWSGYYYGLNILKTEVQDYLRFVFHTVIDEWGFDLLKLDFLFAIAHIKSNKKTRGQILREGMVFLDEISKGAHIIGCGVPLASVYGLFEFSRVSCDVGLKWEDQLMKWINFKERVSTINAIETTINRRHMNQQVFINDPDVFILRDKDQKMTWNQRKTLFLINLIFGGLIFTSDSISSYTKEQMDLYLFAFKLRESEIKSITIGEYIVVELETQNNNYLFIINIKNKIFSIDLTNILKKGYVVNREEVRAYEGFYLKKNK